MVTLLMVTLLGIKNISIADEYLVAQANIKAIEKMVEYLDVKFYQAAFNEYLSESESHCCSSILTSFIQNPSSYMHPCN